MKKLPLGIQSFAKLRKEGYLYIDKTESIYRLFATGGEYYFLSRPRRFGKSLLVSTLKEMFSGNKELFEGLWIYDKIQWETYPVIHIDFLGFNYNNKKELTDTIEYIIEENAHRYGIKLTQKGYDKNFNHLIKELSKINKVVILIDEYDKPIIDHIEDPAIATQNRDVLRTLYAAIKRVDQYLKFAFITGVSKFSQVSVFSGLNNLRDITLADEFATLVGYTQDELNTYFKDDISTLADKLNRDTGETSIQIKERYDGYSWDGQSFVYNPYSILSLFREYRFDNFWFSSATPTFLIKFIHRSEKDIRELDRVTTNGYLFEQFDIDTLDIDSLLFQTGYLTIKERIMSSSGKPDYILTYPNKEVRESFLMHLMKSYTRKGFAENEKLYKRLQLSIYDNDLPRFFQLLKSFFASISYDHFIGDREAFYHSIIYTIIRLIGGVRIDSEVETNMGRIDIVLETSDYIYLMEFKIGSAEKAIKQIKEKKYYEKFLASSKKVKIIGVGFDTAEKNIKEYLIENA